MKIFGKTPGEYLRFAALPLAVLAVFAIVRVDLYRAQVIRPDSPWLSGGMALILTFVYQTARVRLTGFGGPKQLLPLFYLQVGALYVVDALSLAVGRGVPDNFAGPQRAGGGWEGVLLLAVTTPVYWVLAAIVLELTANRERFLLTALFVLLIFVGIVPQIGLGVPFAVAAIGLVAFLVSRFESIAKRYGVLRLGGQVFLVAFLATMVGGVTSCNLQYGNDATAAQLVAALDHYHRVHGRYPESLQGLVPQQLPALPLRFGQDSLPYYYSVEGDQFRLSYSTGFKMGCSWGPGATAPECYD